jgi:hypothetical protein
MDMPSQQPDRDGGDRIQVSALLFSTSIILRRK